MKMVLVGPPGSGKGTISSFLTKEYGTLHISTGEVLRKAIDEGTELGKLAQSLIDKGKFVPDDVAVSIVQEELKDVKHYVLDGFPRNENQAHIFDEMLLKSNEKIDLVLVLDIEDDIILKRLINRRECESCKTTYHLINFPPKEEGICDNCRSNLVKRKDDSNVEKRLETYRNKTIKVASHYEKQGLVKTIYVGKSIQDIFEEIKNIIDSLQ